MTVLSDTLYRYLEEDPTRRQHHDVGGLTATQNSAAGYVARWLWMQYEINPASVHPEVVEHLLAWHAAEREKSRLVLGDDHAERSEA